MPHVADRERVVGPRRRRLLGVVVILKPCAARRTDEDQPGLADGQRVARFVEHAHLDSRPGFPDAPGMRAPFGRRHAGRATFARAVELPHLGRRERVEDPFLHRYGARRAAVHDQPQRRKVECSPLTLGYFENPDEVSRRHERDRHLFAFDESEPLPASQHPSIPVA